VGGRDDALVFLAVAVNAVNSDPPMHWESVASHRSVANH